MPPPGPAKPPPLKIADWPDPRHIALALLIVALVPFIYEIYKLLFKGGPWTLEQILICAGGALFFALGLALYKWLAALFIDDPPPPPEEKLPSPICPHCGYDVRATLLRCPECGHDTPFKLWLDRQNPLERALFEKRLTPITAPSPPPTAATAHPPSPHTKPPPALPPPSP